MAARWKHPNHKNHHEQMLIRCALVAYAMNYGADSAARKFNCSIPCVYQWRDKILNGYLGPNLLNYEPIMGMIMINEDYQTYVIFD